MSSDDAGSSFTVLDWIGALFAGVAIALLVSLSLYAPRFRAMYADFGDVALPTLTAIVTQPCVPPLLALVAALPLANAFRRTPLRSRRFWVAAAFVLACGFLAVCAIGLYMPIFAIAGTIRAE